MEIFRSLKTFLFNHRRKFIISGVVVGSAVAVVHYLRQQEEKRQKYEIDEFFKVLRRQRHFETIQLTCEQTTVSLCKRMEKRIIDIINIDLIVADLKINTKDFLQWEMLKISTFTQICLLVYAQTFLIFVLKIQFAIIGGYLYKNLNEKNEQINRDLQEKYLSLCVEFMKDGLYDLCEFIKNKVTNIVSGLDLKKKLSITNVLDIFWSIQACINNDEFIESIPAYLRIKAEIKKTYDSTLRLIYEETTDILSTKELTSSCVNSMLNHGFVCLTNELVNILSLDGKSKETTLPTVKILPILHNMIKSKLNNTYADEWLWDLMAMEKLKVLSTNVYESYC
ncbi:hypothetical protein PGB90_003304 [Kerria lacca]